MPGSQFKRYVIQLFKVIVTVILFSNLSACETLQENKEKAASSAQSKAIPSHAGNSPLWRRIRNNFELIPNKKNTTKEPRSNHQLVQKHVKQFRKHDNTINKLSEKATPYLFYVVEQLEKRHMPGELALLPMIESAYEPHATSHRGATGLWQFIPSTGRLYGLKQNAWYDERRDIKASTKAALDYLEFLHKEFNQDWMLAIAAYNAGEGTVHRAIKRNILAGKPTSFWDLNLPKETREYVPKFLALAYIIANPEIHEIALPHIDNKPYFVPVNPGTSLSFHQVAKFADIPITELKRLNSGFHKSCTHPKGGPEELLLPVANAKKFENHFAKER